MSANAPWEPTRVAGLERLGAFLPHAGASYARLRNIDAGPGKHNAVSTLSPWIRHRLLTETEVLRAVLSRHSLAAADKFVQEVAWRTYWKGWLELRPSVWRDYTAGVDNALDALGQDAARSRRYDSAVTGRTGLACFDAWVRELVTTGYLHNHARMWFASIWAYTLDLPWMLGADFFLRHLLDGDPASNTLSWRWVVGLQTRGKTYLARAANIERYTRGRFAPHGELASHAPALEGPPHPAPRALGTSSSPVDGIPTGLLVHEDDLLAEHVAPMLAVRTVAGFHVVEGRSPLAAADAVHAFADGAVRDALGIHARHRGVPAVPLGGATVDDILAWARQADLRQVVTPWAPVGPAGSVLEALEAPLAAEGIGLVRVRRDWDARAWPLAERGFFAFRKQLPALVEAAGLGSGAH